MHNNNRHRLTIYQPQAICLSRTVRLFVGSLLLLTACSIIGVGNSSVKSQTKASGLVEGRDYVVLERFRILDQMAFDRPVEAMSILVPHGWRAEGGIRWKGINECRGEMASWQVSATSPDGAIRFMRLPDRAFLFFQDQMLQRGALAAQQQGGCTVSPPFNAAQYLENLARNGFGGANVSNIRADPYLGAGVEKLVAMSNETSRQYGTGMQSSGSAVYGTLTWPDGSKGLAQVALMVSMTRSNDMFTGAPNGSASTVVFHQVVIRYPPAREAEALKVFGTISASHRVNPIWKQAKENFMTRLGNMEHAGRMERLRLQGEQSAAYARAQSDASDARMRDWERAQASSDASQHRFIQTIREVETWKDSSGTPVELNAGYSHGWSRPDGSYILTNNSLFNPAVEFQQNWERMEKPRP
jgi:hypothetical protein